MTKKIGVIAEDNSDVEVLKAFIARMSKNKQFKISKFVGNGCGKIKGKCHGWSKALKAQGCQYLILVHDLDDRVTSKLYPELYAALKPVQIENHVVIIPVKEMEAWLLCDNEAIQKALKLKTLPKKVSNTESILDPKKKLGEIVSQYSSKTMVYLNTIHNVKIAEKISIEKCRLCTSFLPFEKYVMENIAA